MDKSTALSVMTAVGVAYTAQCLFLPEFYLGQDGQTVGTPTGSPLWLLFVTVRSNV